MKRSKIVLLSNLMIFTLMARPPVAEAQNPAEQQPSRVEHPDYSVPESFAERVRRESAFLEVSLKDAIRLALLKNLDIEIEEYNEELNRQILVQNQGFYDPVLNFTIGRSVSDRPSGSTLTAGAGVNVFSQTSHTFNQSLDWNLPGGASFTFTLNNQRSANNSTFSNPNPQFNSNMEFDVTQPLWRGFRKTNTWRQLKLTNLDGKITDSQFRQRVAEVIEQVKDQYWELVFAIDNHETNRQSVELAIIQYRDNQTRVRIGVLAPIEITSAESEVATRQQAMIQAEVQIVNAQNALKRLLAEDPQDSIWNLTLLPTDTPNTSPVDISMEDAINKALANRPELEQIDFQVDQQEVDHEYWKNQGKPQVNFRFNWGTAGLSGTPITDDFADIDGDGVPERVGVPRGDLADNFTASLSQVFTGDFTHYSTFVDVQIPIFNRTNEAQVAQTNIQKARLLSQRRNQQQLILVDVRNAFEGLTIQRKSLEAASVARRLAQEQLDGENKRYQAGMSTNFEVLRFQRDLADAQSQELRAKVDYQQAVVALEKAMFTIIDTSDVQIARDR